MLAEALLCAFHQFADNREKNNTGMIPNKQTNKQTNRLKLADLFFVRSMNINRKEKRITFFKLATPFPSHHKHYSESHFLFNCIDILSFY